MAISNEHKYKLDRMNKRCRDADLGTELQRASASELVKLTYDFAVDGGAIGTIEMRRLDDGSVYNLPDNARVIRAYYEVLTTATSATDAATISLGIDTDDAAGLEAATAISAGGNVWDAGVHDCIQDGAAANVSEKTTAATRSVDLVIAVEALTAGKLTLCLEVVVME